MASTKYDIYATTISKKMSALKLLLALMPLLASRAFATQAPDCRTYGSSTGRVPSLQRELDRNDGLPTTPRVNRFFELVKAIDLNHATLKDGPGGISVDLNYETLVGDQKVIGNFLSTNRRDQRGDNGTGNPEGHIVSFNLARLLGVSDIYSTGTWYTLDAPQVEALHAIAASTNSGGSARKENKGRVFANTAPVNGIYPRIEGSFSVYMEKKLTLRALGGRPLENIQASPNGQANEDNILVQVMMGKKPLPTEQERYTINTDKKDLVTINATQALKDLSSMFIIDAIMEQGDRFSGDNFDVLRLSDGTYRIASLDNGAAGVPGYFKSYPAKYLNWIRRFDRNVAEELFRLDAFLQCGGEYLGFKNQDQLLKSIGLRKFKNQFVNNVHRVALHLKSLQQKP